MINNNHNTHTNIYYDTISTNLNYAVATAVLYTPEENTIILRFIIFEDGTVFEFYGNFGSLRSHINIDISDAKNIIDMNRYIYNDIIISTYLFNKLKAGLISQYIDTDEVVVNITYVKKIFVLTDELGNTFIKRILENDILYSEQSTLELFNTYIKYLCS